MLFNSLSFTIFLPIVYILYWFLSKRKLHIQNILLLVSSYFFYACWDWRFMFLLFLSTLIDYFIGIRIYQEAIRKRKLFWLWLSISINLGILGFFKYYNFFTASFSEALSLLGLKVHFKILQILLPVGISFYTFHGLSYVIDLYRDKIKPEKNIINYSLFVSFFPLLVAGPIERASHLLPQINKERTFCYRKTVDGLQQILWGFFKKIVIADSCAQFTNIIFANTIDQSGSSLLVGAILFSFQIYGDFSGYSDIAIGTAKLFGIELLQNFSFPYFSRNIAEFWRRWHISLTSWFRDYLYIPLGGSHISSWLKTRNTMIIFLVSGFWHGANWTFLVWGFIHALLFIPLLLTNTNRHYVTIVAIDKKLPSLKASLQMIGTFILVSLAWIFFRASNISQAWHAVTEIFSASLFTIPNFEGIRKIPVTIILIIIFMIVEWLGRRGKYAIESIAAIKSKSVRWLLYYTIITIIFFLGSDGKDFIYFQF